MLNNPKSFDDCPWIEFAIPKQIYYEAFTSAFFESGARDNFELIRTPQIKFTDYDEPWEDHEGYRFIQRNLFWEQRQT